MKKAIILTLLLTLRAGVISACPVMTQNNHPIPPIQQIEIQRKIDEATFDNIERNRKFNNYINNDKKENNIKYDNSIINKKNYNHPITQ